MRQRGLVAGYRRIPQEGVPTVAELLKPIAERRGAGPALIDAEGATSWVELDERTNRLVSGLRGLGVADHDTIALLVPNRREFFEVFCAATHGRWIVVPVNWHWVAEELAYVIGNSGATTVIVDERFLDVAGAARLDERAAACDRWIVVGSSSGADGYERYESVIEAGAPDEPVDQGMGGPMFYTSGTTGFPKGVRTTLADTTMPPGVMSLIAASFTEMLGLPADGVTFLNGPAYHSAQWVFSMFPLLSGSTVVMTDKFDAAESLRIIDEHGVTNTHFVPTQMLRLLRLPDDVRGSFDGSSLRAVFHGAAPCPAETKRRMLEWLGPVVHEYYGGTEGGFISMITGAEWPDHQGSLGRALPMMDIAVIDDDGNDCGPGRPGQIWFRSKMGADFEYHDDPEKTAAAHRTDGYGTLGDIGYLDHDGYLFLSDRKIDMIISGGVNIYPAEIEGVLAGHPVVADAAVFGIPDDEMGEQVKAVVELVEGAEVDGEFEAELIAFVRQHLAGYKAPKSIDIAEALPRHPTGKLYKRLLRDPYWEGRSRNI